MARSAGRVRKPRRRETEPRQKPAASRTRSRRDKAVAASLPREEEIVAIAAEIFYRQGFDGTKLDDIARDAGIGKTSLYRYFASKEQIYERLVNNVIGTFDMEEELSRDIPADERLQHIIRARLEQTTSHPAEVGLISRQLVRMEGPVGEWARRFRRHDFNVLRELVVQGQRARCFRAGDPDIIAATIMGLLTQVCDWYRPSGRVDRQSLIDEMVEYIVRGVSELG